MVKTVIIGVRINNGTITGFTFAPLTLPSPARGEGKPIEIKKSPPP